MIKKCKCGNEIFPDEITKIFRKKCDNCFFKNNINKVNNKLWQQILFYINFCKHYNINYEHIEANLINIIYNASNEKIKLI